MQLPHNSSKESGEKNGPHNIISHDFSGQPAPVGASNEEPDFSDFMWMANEDLDAFDRKVLSEIHERFGLESGNALDEEEEFLHKMLEEEEERETVYYGPAPGMRGHNESMQDLNNRMRRMGVTDEIAAQSNLNPHAAEFVPGQSFQNPEAAAPVPIMQHHSIPQSVAGPMYSHNNLPNPLPTAGLNNIPPSISPNLHQNILLSHNSHPQLNQQRFNSPMRAQLNGHSAIRRYFPNVIMPVYMSNAPVYHGMNGVPFVPAQQNRYPHPESDRTNEDEGYGDN